MKRLRFVFYIFIASFLLYSLTKNFFSYKDKVSFYEDLQNEYNKEENRNKKLKSDIQKGSDYYYVERNIREKLNLLQKDEIAIIIPPITPTPSPTPIIIKKPYEQWADLLTRNKSL